MRRGTNKILLAAACACSFYPDNGDLENAFIFHWTHDNVTMEKFVVDHKGCLGVKGRVARNQLDNMLTPMEPMTVPKWDDMWATFESRGYREAGQRIAFSIPSGTSAPMLGSYQTCMQDIGYKLTYRRW
ncbi:MAG: hypothetical protein LBT92_02370 [Rickettsiales bacterium]|jgi:hypothetical protein|nr:hypothetical protein [Rickettsiales bacterium]